MLIKKINMNKITNHDLISILSVTENRPIVIKTERYLNLDCEDYRGFSGYAFGILSIVFSLFGFMLIWYTIRKE